MKILDAIADGIGGAFNQTATIASDPLGHLKGVFDDSVIKAIMQDPANFQEYLMELEKQGKSIDASMPPIPSSYQPVPMAQTGGFIRDMPTFMNNSQRILAGGY